MQKIYKKPCPVSNALAIIGGKWKINIIYQLSKKTTRFGELRRVLGNITQQMFQSFVCHHNLKV